MTALVRQREHNSLWLNCSVAYLQIGQKWGSSYSEGVYPIPSIKISWLETVMVVRGRVQGKQRIQFPGRWGGAEEKVMDSR